mgnify:CR=1 FL=1
MRRPQSFRSRLGLIVALGAVLRLAMLAHRWNRPLTLNDSLWYSVAATQLRHGEFFTGVFRDGPTAEHPPLTSLLMTPLSFLSDPVQGQRLTTTLFGIVLVALVGVLGRRINGPATGLVAAFLAAIYPNIWTHDGLVMAESIAMVLIVCWMLAMLRLLERPSWQRAITAGALAGLSALTRSETALLAVAGLIMLLWRSRHREALLRAAAMTLATVIVLLPWTIVNMTRFERPVLLTTNDGTTLLGAYCDDVYSGANKGGWSLFCVLNAPEVEGDDSVRSAQQRRWALSFARDHLPQLPGVVVARVARSLDLYGLSDIIGGDVGEDQERPVVWAGIAMWWALAPLAALGVRRLRRRERAVVLAPAVVVAITTLVFYGNHRLRAPLEPSLVLLAAVTLVHWWHSRHSADGGSDHTRDAISTGVGELPGS